MQKCINYQHPLPMHLKYSFIHDLLKNIFQQLYDMAIFKTKSSILEFLGYFLWYFGPKKGSKINFGPNKKKSTKNSPDDIKKPKKLEWTKARGPWSLEWLWHTDDATMLWCFWCYSRYSLALQLHKPSSFIINLKNMSVICNNSNLFLLRFLVPIFNIRISMIIMFGLGTKYGAKMSREHVW